MTTARWPLAGVLGVALVCGAVDWRYWRTKSAGDLFARSSQDFRTGDYAGASAHLDQALRIWPENPYYAFVRGLVASRVAERELTRADGPVCLRSALDYYDRALKVSPNDDAARHNRGWIRLWLGDRERAAEDMRAAAKINPRESAYWISLGLIGERDSAELAAHNYASAIAVNPEVLESLFFRQLQSRAPAVADEAVEEARQKLVRAAGARSGPIALARLGKLCLERGEYDSARGYLSRAAAILPNLPRVWSNLGLYWEARNDRARAIEYYRRSLFLDQDFPLALMRIGDGLYSEGNYRETLRYYTQAATLCRTVSSEHSHQVGRMYFVEAAVQNDLVPRGLLRYVRPAIELRDLFDRISVCYDHVGKPKEARQYREMEVPVAGDIAALATVGSGPAMAAR